MIETRKCIVKLSSWTIVLLINCTAKISGWQCYYLIARVLKKNTLLNSQSEVSIFCRCGIKQKNQHELIFSCPGDGDIWTQMILPHGGEGIWPAILSQRQGIWPTAISKVQMPGGCPGGILKFELIDTLHAALFCYPKIWRLGNAKYERCEKFLKVLQNVFN